jgi:hypothetical protein
MNFCNNLIFYGERVLAVGIVRSRTKATELVREGVRPTFNLQAGGPPFVVCQRLLIQCSHR